MMGVDASRAELARRFAEEVDLIASRGAAPDCAERIAAINAAFDAECVRLKAEEAERDGKKKRPAKS